MTIYQRVHIYHHFQAEFSMFEASSDHQRWLENHENHGSERPFWLIHLRREIGFQNPKIAMSQEKLLNGCLFPPNMVAIDFDASPYLSTRQGCSQHPKYNGGTW